MQSAAIPQAARSKHLRACLLCSVVQTVTDFRLNGCPNCEDIIQLKNNSEHIQTCTTAYFDGIIAVIDPESSWVAKWQRTSQYVRGMYAVRLKGQLPEDVENILREQNIKYRPRDQTIMD